MGRATRRLEENYEAYHRLQHPELKMASNLRHDGMQEAPRVHSSGEQSQLPPGHTNTG